MFAGVYLSVCLSVSKNSKKDCMDLDEIFLDNVGIRKSLKFLLGQGLYIVLTEVCALLVLF